MYAIGGRDVVETGMFVTHDDLGDPVIGTVARFGLGILFVSDSSRRLRTSQQVAGESLLLTFHNADGPVDFGDFVITLGGHRYDLLVMVVSAGRARQVSFTLMEG